MSYFGVEKVSRETLRHKAHGELVRACAKHIAAIEGLEAQQIAMEALWMYMSIKVGDTKRETIVDAYKETLEAEGLNPHFEA